MNYDHLNDVYDDYLEHYGILGMKWGVRRYQNADGTLTSAGKKRYKNDTPEQIERSERRKAKVKKAVKRVTKIAVKAALIGLTGSVAVSALSSLDNYTVTQAGNTAVSALLKSGALDKNTADALVSKAVDYNLRGGFDGRLTSSQAELAGAIGSYYWNDLKRQFR